MAAKKSESFFNFECNSRRSKKAAYIRIKNHIRRDAALHGGKFTSHHVLNGKNGWLDIDFLGRKRPRFYAITLVTTRRAYINVVQQRAMEMSYELAPKRKPLFPDQAEEDTKTGRLFIRYRERLCYLELVGMTRYEWVFAQYPAIANGGDITVNEQWTVDRRYSVGIGLHATVNVPFLTVETVNQFIDRFLVDETDFFNPTPLNYRYEDIPNWGVDANTVTGISEEKPS